MTGRALIAHGGPQRYPTRAAPSLMRALRDARGSPPWTPWTILCRLTGTTGLMQPLLVSTVQIAATLSPTPSAASLNPGCGGSSGMESTPPRRLFEMPLLG